MLKMEKIEKMFFTYILWCSLKIPASAGMTLPDRFSCGGTKGRLLQTMNETPTAPSPTNAGNAAMSFLRRQEPHGGCDHHSQGRLFGIIATNTITRFLRSFQGAP